MTPAAAKRWETFVSSGGLARTKPAASRVYAVILTLVLPGEGCQVQVSDIASLAGVCRKSTRAAIETLYRLGLIIRHREGPAAFRIYTTATQQETIEVEKTSRLCSRRA